MLRAIRVPRTGIRGRESAVRMPSPRERALGLGGRPCRSSAPQRPRGRSLVTTGEITAAEILRGAPPDPIRGSTLLVRGAAGGRIHGTPPWLGHPPLVTARPLATVVKRGTIPLAVACS